MRHAQVRHLLGAYHDGELDKSRTAKIDEHLKSCGPCRQDLDRLAALETSARLSVPAEPGEAYWESLPSRVMSGIGEARRSVRSKEDAMFQDSFFVYDRNLRTKAFVLPLSIIVHALVIIGLVAIPLLNTRNLPQVEIISAFLAPPTPAPPPPPPPAAKKRSSSRTARIKPVQAQEKFQTGKLVAPVVIPDQIVEEKLSDVGIDGGVEGGVEGGVVGGVLGGVVGGILGGVVGEVEAPVRAVGNIKPPKLIKEVAPEYPEIARQARVEGVVIIEATTDVYGRVVSWKVLRSIPLLDQAAIDAVKQWVYEPMVISGRPRGVIFTVTVRFKLK